MYQCSYVEIAIALEIETGVGIGGPNADPCAKANMVVKILRFIVSEVGVTLSGDKSKQSFKKLFAPRLLKCARDLTGTWLHGISRRLVSSRHDVTEAAIAANLCLAKQYLDVHYCSSTVDCHAKNAWKLFGKGFSPKTKF